MKQEQFVCVEEGVFEGIEYAEGFDFADGVLGLGLDSNGDRSMLAQLKNLGIIEKKIFSLYLEDVGLSSGGSEIMFGGYDSYKIKKDDDMGYGIHWYSIVKSHGWSLTLHGFLYGDKEMKRSGTVYA